MNTKLFGDVLMDFGNGCRLDLRVKLAMDLLRADTIPFTKEIESRKPAETFVAGAEWVETQTVDLTPAERVTIALDMAGALIDQANERGWIAPLPEGDGLEPSHQAHIRRGSRVQVLHGTSQQKMVSDESSGLAVPRGGLA